MNTPPASHFGPPTADRPSKLSRRLRPLRNLALTAAAVLVLLGILWGVENMRGWWTWRAERERVVTAKRPIILEELIPPLVPPERNLAMIPLLRPLFDLNPDANATNRWRDPEAYQRALGVLNLVRIHGNPSEPPQGSWRHGEPCPLPKWPPYFRQTGRAAQADNGLRQRYGLAPLQDREGGKTNPAAAYPLPATPGAPAEDVLLALQLFDADFVALHEGLKLPECRFDIPYEDGYAAILPHLAVLKQWTRTLGLRALARLATGDAARAFVDAEDGLRLADTLRTEPFLISQLVRQAYLTIALQPVWEGQVRHQWSEPQLATLQTRLEKFEILDSYRHALSMERANLLRTVEQALSSWRGRRRFAIEGDAIWGNARRQEADPWLGPYLLLAPRGWLYASVAASSHAIRELEELDPRQLPGLRTRWSAWTTNNSWRLVLHTRFVSSGLTFGFPYSAVSAFAAETQRRLALTACALERSLIAHGTYPETLDQLVPRFFATVPEDPITGQPLRYTRLERDRFRLWSIGEDGVDDQAAWPEKGAEKQASERGDWVWGWPSETPK